jgi:hypothetical protein
MRCSRCRAEVNWKTIDDPHYPFKRKYLNKYKKPLCNTCVDKEEPFLGYVSLKSIPVKGPERKKIKKTRGKE